ncbi:MAG: hypothetical protein SVC26_04370 [Pseudomonadota bacterium]|nr:hypothetical protein [Pseudomonadota bacterium]
MHNGLAVVLSSGFVPELRETRVEDMIITLFEDDLFRYGPQPITAPYTVSNLVTIDT